MGPACVGPLSDYMTSWALDTVPRVRGSVWSFVELKFVLERLSCELFALSRCKVRSMESRGCMLSLNLSQKSGELQVE